MPQKAVKHNLAIWQ